MGHIVNARGMRLGLKNTWCDLWYSEILFYTEHLHALYRMRYFIIYYFNMYALELRGFFFSHFLFFKNYKRWHVNIYYYDGQAESLFTCLMFDFAIITIKDLNNNNPETKISRKLFEPYKIFIIFNLFLPFTFIKWKKKFRKKFMWFFKRGKIHLLFRHLHESLKIDDKFCTKIEKKDLEKKRKLVKKTLFIYYIMFFYQKKLYKKAGMYTRTRLDSVLKKIFVMWLGHDWMYGFFDKALNVLEIVLTIINPSFSYKIAMYAISNNCVNAKFLSRFIARKFAQLYGFYELINPIRRELRLVCKETKSSYKGVFFGKIRHKINSQKAKIYRNYIYKSYITYLFINYNKYSYKFFFKNLTFFSLNMLSIFIWINKIFIINKFIIYYASKYFIRRSAFSYFFSGNFKIHLKLFNKFFRYSKINKSILQFRRQFKFTNFFNFIFEDYITNNNVLFLSNIKIRKNFTKFYYAQLHFKRFMQFKFWKYNHGLYALGSFYNPLKKRILQRKKGGLIGFKMQCSGRFTRRQRASSIWFSYGKVPLCTLNENIDYSFFSKPITNSIITIKVWLHISNKYPTWYFRLI